jgi:hypothetical protein
MAQNRNPVSGSPQVIDARTEAATGYIAQNRRLSKQVTIALRFEYDRHL